MPSVNVLTTYSDKLKDPRWQRKRLEILQRDEWACRSCGDKTNTLHVHHRWYVSGREPWEYPDVALLSLCQDCHKGSDLEEDESTVVVLGWEALIDVARAGWLGR